MKKSILAVSLLGGASSAFAAEPSLTSLTNAISFAEVGTAAIAIGTALVGLYVIIKGVQIVVSMVRGR